MPRNRLETVAQSFSISSVKNKDTPGPEKMFNLGLTITGDLPCRQEL